MKWSYLEENRIGDHICYYSDLRKMRAHYPRMGALRSRSRISFGDRASWAARLRPAVLDEASDYGCLRIRRLRACGSSPRANGRPIDYGYRQLDAARSRRRIARACTSCGVAFIHGDIRLASDLEALRGVDWVIDAAANPSVLGWGRRPDDQPSVARAQSRRHDPRARILQAVARRAHAALSSSRVYSIAALVALAAARQRRGLRVRMRPRRCRLAPPPAGSRQSFPLRAPVSLYGSTKLAARSLLSSTALRSIFRSWVNRCGVIAGAGQFGTPEQGIFSFWVRAWASPSAAVYRLRRYGQTGSRRAPSGRPGRALSSAQIRDGRRARTATLYGGGGPENAMSLRAVERLVRRALWTSRPSSRPEPAAIRHRLDRHGQLSRATARLRLVSKSRR